LRGEGVLDRLRAREAGLAPAVIASEAWRSSRGVIGARIVGAAASVAAPSSSRTGWIATLRSRRRSLR